MMIRSSSAASRSQTNQPVVGPVTDRDAPQAVAEGAAPHRGAARIGLQRIDRVIDGVQ